MRVRGMVEEVVPKGKAETVRGAVEDKETSGDGGALGVVRVRGSARGVVEWLGGLREPAYRS